MSYQRCASLVLVASVLAYTPSHTHTHTCTRPHTHTRTTHTHTHIHTHQVLEVFASVGILHLTIKPQNACRLMLVSQGKGDPVRITSPLQNKVDEVHIRHGVQATRRLLDDASFPRDSIGI